MSSVQGYITDEDFDNDLLRGLVRRLPQLDVLRVQDVGLAGADDPVILEWAAQQGRILLTHDAKTMPNHAHTRLRAGQRVAGVCVIPQAVPIGQAIEELRLLIECSVPAELGESGLLSAAVASRPIEARGDGPHPRRLLLSEGTDVPARRPSGRFGPLCGHRQYGSGPVRPQGRSARVRGSFRDRRARL